MRNRNLIDDISNKLKVSYISDIKSSKYYTEIYRFLSDVNTEEYSIDQWRDLANYFEIKNKNLQTSEELKDFIIEQLKK